MTGPVVDRAARRTLIEGHRRLDGIDFVEVVSNDPALPGRVRGAPRQRTLLVHLLNNPVPDGWTAADVAVTGGVRPDPRVNPVLVEWAYPAPAVLGKPAPPGVTPADQRLVASTLPPEADARAKVLVVRTSTSGDWSEYELLLVDPPEHFDGPLSRAPFTFTVDCPTDLDCCPPETAPVPAAADGTVVDYLARDYDALRTRLLDRLSTLLPGWTDRNAADPAVMLVELFATLGDRLAYWQDAAAVEAYLGTARQRTSVRRHARLLGYAVHEGCSARTWLALAADSVVEIGVDAAVSDRPAREPARPEEADDAGAAVFETRAGVTVRPPRNQLAVHAWGDPDHVLAAGTTAAYLAHPAGRDPGLHAGDVLVLAGCPASLDPRDGDPAARHVVRLVRDPVPHTDGTAPDRTVLEVHWHPDDALPRPLRVTEPGPDGRAATRLVALANVVLADHGATVGWEDLDRVRGRHRLARTGLAYAVEPDPGASAAALARPDPRQARAQLVLDDGRRRWEPAPDLIASGRLHAHVVVEPGPDGSAWLRFGDGVTGRAPHPQARFQARYRVGGGTPGNVGADRLTTWLLRPDGRPPVPDGVEVTVWNPLGATGGTDPEPAGQVRELAPSAYRRQLRAVTDADYAATAQSVPGVQRSLARRRWTGSWYAEEVTVDPRAGRDDVDTAVLDLLETRRMAGRDVEVTRPVYAPLHLTLFACVAAGFEPPDVGRRLAAALSGTAFFHPDRFTFGQPLFLSDLVAAAMAVAGVSWVEPRRFARLGAPPAATRDALAAGRIDAQPREVLRCDSDPNNPEAGRVDLLLGGGA